ncbi:MAG: response regulator [Planctomycetota bacterium]|nr:MAG: response regulator [Planctomycetota bacterium]
MKCEWGGRNVPNILVVDDSATDRVLAGSLLKQDADFAVSYAENGRVALDAVRADLPDAIVSDLQMPEMNGLELVEAVRRDFPSVPVVLMTARGSESIAAEALRRGAASYVPKASLGESLRDTVLRIITAASADRLHSRLMHSLDECECRFALRNDVELIEPLVAHYQEMLRCLPLGDEAERLRVGVALKQALWIAHHHGNLEIPLDAGMDDASFRELAAERRFLLPYSARSLSVSAHVTCEQAIFCVSHEGECIDVGRLPADNESVGGDHLWLSGFAFMPSVFDDVRYEEGGTRICLLKKAHVCEEPLDIDEE